MADNRTRKLNRHTGRARPPQTEGRSALARRFRSPWLAWVAVLLVAGVFALVGMKVSSWQRPTYKATAVVHLIDPASRGMDMRGDELTRWVDSRAEDLSSGQAMQAAAEALGDGTTAQQLDDAVDVTADAEALSMSVTASAPRRGLAAKWANAVTDSYAAREKKRRDDTVKQAAARFQTRLAQVNKEIDAASARLSANPNDKSAPALLAANVDWRLRLQNSAVDAQEQASTAATTLASVQPALPATAPASPRPVQDGAITGVVVALALAGILIRHRVANRPVRGPDEVKTLLRAPLLVDIDTARRKTGVNGDSASAFRFAAATALLHLDGEEQVLLVTSRDGHEIADRVATQIVRAAGQDVAKSSAFAAAGTGDGSVAMASAKAQGLGTRERVGLLDGEQGPDGEATVMGGGHRLVVAAGPPLRRGGDFASAVARSGKVLVVVTEGSTVADIAEARDVLDLLHADVLGFVFLRQPIGR
ncbi:MAG TPA: hypothetical protein VFX33_07665 [Actinomycetales bacterium]|nr:hypothetical protein [Actinomycetales bacterium]